MAHRGRLNVLANIMGKSPWQIFREFEDKDAERFLGHGDVKYHLGHHSDWKSTTGKPVHLVLCFNPSHLEFVGPVANGMVRARQDRKNDPARKQGMAILIHGDAAFAGEGMVQETLNLSELDGYRTGGTVHLVVNNQIGFTTSPSDYGRSSTYATDVAKMLQIPIFHVNGEDPEAVAQVVRLAMDFRREFQRDVVIDMYCYRRRGHNEGDEPSFTQPLMYHAIRSREAVRRGLPRRTCWNSASHARTRPTRSPNVDRASSRRSWPRPGQRGLRSPQGARRPRHGGQGRTIGAEDARTSRGSKPASSAASSRRPARSADAAVPEGFTPHPKIEALLDLRGEMADGRRSRSTGRRPRRWPSPRWRRGRLPRPPDRPGQPARHLQPPPCGAARLRDRQRIHAPAAPERGPGALRDHQQPAVRGRGAGLRVRLQPQRAGRPGDLGGPVRRLRQRRPGDHRPVHRQRRGQVAPAVAAWCCCCRTASRAWARSTPAPASSVSSG